MRTDAETPQRPYVHLGALARCDKARLLGSRQRRDSESDAAALVHEMMEAGDEKRLLRLQSQLAKCNLLIMDELGFVPLSMVGTEPPVRGLLSKIRTRFDPGDLEPAVR